MTMSTKNPSTSVQLCLDTWSDAASEPHICKRSSSHLGACLCMCGVVNLESVKEAVLDRLDEVFQLPPEADG